MKVEHVVITPDVAKQMLNRSRAQNVRKLKSSHVAYLAADMRNGRWYNNGETIKLDDRGNVLDGQHRLHAVIASDTSIKALVVTVPTNGHAEHIAGSIDVGMRRTPSQILSAGGVPNPNNVAAALQVVYRQSIGAPWYGPPSAIDTERGAGSSHRLRAHLVMDFYRQHPGILDAVRDMDSLSGRAFHLFPVGIGAGVLYLMREVDADCINFVVENAFHNPQKHSNPTITALENRIANISGGPKTGRPVPVYRCALLVKTWQLLRKGREVSQVVIKYPAEPLPTID